MNAAALVILNVLVSAALSLVGAWAVVLVPSHALRRGAARVVLLLLVLPFVKAAIEIGRGVPDGAFFWMKLEGARQELGSFQAGVGAHPFGPALHVALGAVFHGKIYPQSGADLLAALLEKKVGPRAPAFAGAILFAIGSVQLARAAMRGLRELARAKERHAAAIVDRVRVDVRTVTIHVGASSSAVPYAGGVLRPFVMVPNAVAAALSEDELRAVIAHEIAHVRAFDPVLLTVLGTVRAVMWFVPGVSWLAKRARTVMEHAADESATTRGTSPTVLASALVRVGELAATRSLDAPALAAATSPSLLARRVDVLLRDPVLFSMRRIAWHAFLAAAAVATVLSATTLGNP